MDRTRRARTDADINVPDGRIGQTHPWESRAAIQKNKYTKLPTSFQIALPSMKLILIGATGFVGTECLRLALQNPAFTEIVALARRDVKLPESTSDGDKARFTTVILEDMSQNYPSNVKEKLRGADACIW